MSIDYGYVRVSTKDQHTDRQYNALSEEGILPKHIFVDMQSGKDFNRPEYRKLLKKLKAEDTVFITSIDRLGRNYDEIISQWQLITKEIRANIVVLDMPLLDTRKKDRDLTGTFIADLVLQILSYVAETERENIRKRQAEGIAAAKKKGVHMGRKPRELPPMFDETVLAWRKKEIPLDEALKRLSCGKTYFFKKVKERDLSDLLQ